MEDLDFDNFEFSETDDTSFEDSSSDSLIESDELLGNINSEDEFVDEVLNESPYEDVYDPAFMGSIYNEAEIENLKNKASSAEYEMQCRLRDVENWKSKLSLNDTKEHRENGDYYNALRHLQEAERRLSDARSSYNDAARKYNNAL